MEFFLKAKVVRLRSHHDKYMLANEDQENVYQDRNGCYDNAKWTVELLGSNNNNVIRLKSCYGKYLTASNMPFLLKSTGKQVLQTLPKRLGSSVEWEPIRDGVQVKLRTRYGQYLRGNGGLPPWRNTITHDLPRRTATVNWILWDVDIVELRPKEGGQIPKPRPRPTPIIPPMRCLNDSITETMDNSFPFPSPSSFSDSDNGPLVKIDLKSPRSPEVESEDLDYPSPSPMKEGRVIFYDIGNENGEVVDENKASFFTFRGSSLEELKEKLKEETQLVDILVCCRNPLNAKLYPILLHLPPNNTDMHVVVVPSSFKAN
ncbi:unnamed protein product [Lathyrus oleraceus]|uniref:DUF569 domain-containing protein n=1 Tax=Pisum sativum TaxID=3888 RepID=A0A9D5BG93_PEA|nr:uncharacterized protein LOC127096075 [Pisum sativum]KAI5443113.1 hypothetical protein KIW84_011954 [Pisum sativum]